MIEIEISSDQTAGDTLSALALHLNFDCANFSFVSKESGKLDPDYVIKHFGRENMLTLIEVR